MHHNNNPHTKAANAYGTTTASVDQRSLEGTVLLKAAQMLEDLAKRLESGEKIPLEEIGGTLIHNRKLWQLFLDEMMNKDSLMPKDIKDNVASLAVFVFKRTLEILGDAKPEKFKVLININRSIAAGLMKKPVTQAASASKPPAEATVTNSLA